MEIERKWLVDPARIPYDLSSLPSHELEQSYVSFSPVVRIRSIDAGARYVLTIKKNPEPDGLAQEEAELDLDAATYAFLFSQHSGNVLSKTRYLHRLPSGLLEEIDLFHGDLEGLAYMEIEFPDMETARAYASPDWVKADVTQDLRYKNAALAQHGRPQD